LIWAAAALAIDYGVLPWKKRPTFKAVEKCLRQALAVIESRPSADASPESVLSTLKQKLESADIAEVVLREPATPDQVRDRVNADGFRINGDIYLKPDRLRAWLPSKTARALLKGDGVLRTRREDVDTTDQLISGIPGKLRYYVLDASKVSSTR
jgi:hypothetical protein